MYREFPSDYHAYFNQESWGDGVMISHGGMEAWRHGCMGACNHAIMQSCNSNIPYIPINGERGEPGAKTTWQ